MYNSSTMQTVTQHLLSRHMDLALHRPVVNEAERLATFYLWNLSGQMVGYQQYRPEGSKQSYQDPREGRYFTYRNRTTLALWGLESLWLTPHVVFLTEGVFDAARLTQRGYSALAALSNDPLPELKNWLTTLNRRVVVVADNDKAGRKLVKFGDQAVVTEHKDLSDSDDSYVDWLLHKFG